MYSHAALSYNYQHVSSLSKCAHYHAIVKQFVVQPKINALLKNIIVHQHYHFHYKLVPCL